jgi:hypothetical protein
MTSVRAAHLHIITTEPPPAEKNIIVEMPDNVLPRAITTWTAVFLTCTLTVLKEPDEYTGQLYCLDVVKVDPMYKNMD